YGNIANAITYAADNGARVVNLSLGGSANSSTLQDAVNYAWNRGVVVVAAAGNAGTSDPYYPAALSNVIAVGATDQSDAKASFSQSGSWISVVAPGVGVYSTTMDGGYLAYSGTSYSAPQVAALAALIM